MIIIEKSLRLNFSATNNEAEYEALLAGMAMVQKVEGKTVQRFSDSRLIVGQVEGELEARDPRMQKYLNQVRHLQSKFEFFTLVQVPKSRNTHADSLATLATSSAQSLPRVILLEDLHKPTEMKDDIVRVHQIRARSSWIDSVVLFLMEDILPEEKFKVDKTRRKAPRFWLSKDQKLNKRSFSGPYLLCIHPEVTKLLLEELHEGICGRHTGGRSLSHRALTQGTLPKAAGNRSWLLVGIDYFTKWVDYQASGTWMQKGLFGRTLSLVLEFPLPSSQTLVFNLIVRFLEDIAVIYALQIDIPLWLIHRGMDRSKLSIMSTGETPFSMTYGAEAVIPLEISFPTLRKSSFTLSNNNELLERGLDLVEEQRENDMVQLAYY
ncbi:uncharacterized protein LOC142606330 [Castanea sativa]|uniref:uncharacterized protein LOC142606330 n=1 Tax=Castanea sativa TaxID=21020 RepID=UPI003F64BEAC